MSRAALATSTCTVAQAVALVGDEWSFMILREMFLGARRYDEIRRQTGASPHLLSGRLKKLETAGVLRREVYSTRPVRHEYKLTEMGRDLWPAVIAMKQWGDKWLAGGETGVEIAHRSCGHIVQPVMTCPECGEPMQARDAVPHIRPKFANERRRARGEP